MGTRGGHYERGFEAYLRARRIPYISIDEAKKAILPEGTVLKAPFADGAGSAATLKSFDFVVHAPDKSYILDVKGRKVAGRVGADGTVKPTTRSSLQSWVTQDDVRSLQVWQGLFGAKFQAAFLFLYWCEDQPPDALFQEVFEHAGRWYAMRAVSLTAYISEMKPRSLRWKTVHVPTAAFERISQPFCGFEDSVQVQARGRGGGRLTGAGAGE